MANPKDISNSFKYSTAPNQFEQDLRCLIVIEKYMKENPVNGDRVKLTDPLDSENFLTLNELYMRLSKSTKL